MTPNQKRAVENFKTFMERQLNSNPDYRDTLVEFSVTPTDYGTLWITAKTDMLGLDEGNLLRALDAQWWFVHVGKRGALTVKMAPKSFKQFNGRKAFNMNFDC
jgi:hypothetical protein